MITNFDALPSELYHTLEVETKNFIHKSSLFLLDEKIHVHETNLPKTSLENNDEKNGRDRDVTLIRHQLKMYFRKQVVSCS